MNEATHATLDADAAVQVAEYVCGLLRPEERVQVHDRLSHDDAALMQALAWEDRFLALVDALPRVQPPSSLRERLQNTLGIGPPPAFQPPPQPVLLQRESAPHPTLQADSTPSLPATSAKPLPAKASASAAPPVASATAEQPGASSAAGQSRELRRTPEKRKDLQAAREAAANAAADSQGQEKARDPAGGDAQAANATHRTLVRKLWFWRLIGLCSTATAIAGILLPGAPPPPPVQVIKVAPTRAAILQAPGTSSTPAWTATLDPHGNLVMQPLVHTEIPAGSQALLWTRSERVPEPRLLGRIDPNRPVQVPAGTLGALAEDQILEITEERDEDAAKGVPQGPILFIGQMTVFGSNGASAGTQGAAAGSN